MVCNNCGKTFTMNGKGGGSEGKCTSGIVHLAAMGVVDNIETDQERNFAVNVSFVEIYNKEVKDFFPPRGMT